MPRTHRHFPGRYPLSNRYFANRSRWLLSYFVLSQKVLCLKVLGRGQKAFIVAVRDTPLPYVTCNL